MDRLLAAMHEVASDFVQGVGAALQFGVSCGRTPSSSVILTMLLELVELHLISDGDSFYRLDERF
jgi:hypothetical protein